MNRKEYFEKWYSKNRARILKLQKEYREKNKEKIAQRMKEYHQRPEVKARIRKYHKEHSQKPETKKLQREAMKRYRQNPKNKLKEKEYRQRPEIKKRHREWYHKPKNKIMVNQYVKNKLLIDKQFAIKFRLRDLLRKALKHYTRTGKILTSKQYGINYRAIIEQLKPFPKDLSKYHIDHIKPLCSFNLEEPEQIKLAFAPENHQWLLAEDNLSKSSKIVLNLTKYEKEDLQAVIQQGIFNVGDSILYNPNKKIEDYQIENVLRMMKLSCRVLTKLNNSFIGNSFKSKFELYYNLFKESFNKRLKEDNIILNFNIKESDK